jgi:hypothetical protein
MLSGIFAGMFDSQDRRNALKIAEELWRQTGDAMREDLDTFNQYLQTPFVAGYGYGFIRMAFSNLGYGVKSEKMCDKWFSYITHSVILEGKFKYIVKNQIKHMELSEGAEKERLVDEFLKGSCVGAFDAGLKFIDIGEAEAPLNLQRYLLNQKLDELALKSYREESRLA